MPPNELNRPLRRAIRQRSRRSPVIAPAIVGVALVLAVVAAVWVAVVDDPDGGQPVAVASIEDAAPAATGSVSGSARTPADVAEAQPLPAGADDASERAGLQAGPSSTSADPGLIEISSFGPLPRIAPDGRRPRLAYAGRPAATGAGTPKVALVVGGLGLSQTGTQDAIAALPAGVTLAFAPYGASLQRWVDKARADGHEVLLQVPLEPENYPADNPGEHTLLVADRQQTGQDLAWNLARMTSYAGVMNYMGGRFTSDEKALGPVLGEIGARGLFYLDDGSSPQSRAAALGGTLQVPVVTADSIVDAERSPEAIERQLAGLEATARSRGVAVGVATAFPTTLKAVESWAKGAAERGIALVPATAALPD